MQDDQRKALFEAAQADRERCREWLIPHMANGKPKRFTKDQYRQMAMIELGISQSAFDHAWVWAIEDTGRQDWYDPKPRRRDTCQ
jgi:hypothetical protein